MISHVRSFGRLPWRLQAVWVVLGLMFVILFFITVKVKPKDPQNLISQQIAELSAASRRQHEDIVREIRNGSNLHIGALSMPQPNPDIGIGGVIVILDMTGAKSLQDLATAEASKLFETVSEPNSLAVLVLSGKIRIIQLRLITLKPFEAKGGTLPKYAIELQIHNLTSSNLRVNVPRGQVFENTVPRSGFQNLATSDETVLYLAPWESNHLRLLAYCINQGRNQPVNQLGYLTSLRLKFDFADQNELWSEIDKRVPAGNRR